MEYVTELDRYSIPFHPPYETQEKLLSSYSTFLAYFHPSLENLSWFICPCEEGVGIDFYIQEGDSLTLYPRLSAFSVKKLEEELKAKAAEFIRTVAN